MPAGYVHGPAAATDGLDAALTKTPDPVAMILVEGVSDQIAVETLATRRGRDLVAERIAVVPIGGAGAIRRVLATHASSIPVVTVLCDVGEERAVRRGIATAERDVAVVVCSPDLEGELIAAVGMERALAVVDAERDRAAFTTLQKQAAWRGRPAADQLRRFIGAGAGRKLRYARSLTDAAVDTDRVPAPLAAVLAF